MFSDKPKQKVLHDESLTNEEPEDNSESFDEFSLHIKRRRKLGIPDPECDERTQNRLVYVKDSSPSKASREQSQTKTSPLKKLSKTRNQSDERVKSPHCSKFSMGIYGRSRPKFVNYTGGMTRTKSEKKRLRKINNSTIKKRSAAKKQALKYNMKDILNSQEISNSLTKKTPYKSQKSAVKTTGECSKTALKPRKSVKPRILSESKSRTTPFSFSSPTTDFSRQPEAALKPYQTVVLYSYTPSGRKITCKETTHKYTSAHSPLKSGESNKANNRTEQQWDMSRCRQHREVAKVAREAWGCRGRAVSEGSLQKAEVRIVHEL